MKKTLKGFTLVELLVVIAIIGLLSTVAVVALNSARAKSRDAKRVADVKQIQTALELYFNSNNRYPVETAIPLGITNTQLSDDGFDGDGGTNTYMGLIPRDPGMAGAATVCGDGSVASCDYQYETPANDTSPKTYKIRFYLEGTTASLAAGLKCGTQDGLKEPTGAGAQATCP